MAFVCLLCFVCFGVAAGREFEIQNAYHRTDETRGVTDNDSWSTHPLTERTDETRGVILPCSDLRMP